MLLEQLQQLGVVALQRALCMLPPLRCRPRALCPWARRPRLPLRSGASGPRLALRPRACGSWLPLLSLLPLLRLLGSRCLATARPWPCYAARPWPCHAAHLLHCGTAALLRLLCSLRLLPIDARLRSQHLHCRSQPCEEDTMCKM